MHLARGSVEPSLVERETDDARRWRGASDAAHAQHESDTTGSYAEAQAAANGCGVARWCRAD